MKPLPIDDSIPEILEKLKQSRSLVLVAPPGAGKTTRVPPAILRANLLSADHPNLVILQPRRVAARTVAARIADENGWKLGQEVGYHVRFDRMLQKTTRLRVLTEGILTRQLLDDPFLEGIGAVLLDEFHERSLNTDMAVALLLEVQQTVRPDLILVVMSATMDAEPAAAFLAGCPIVKAQGRTFPIEIAYESASQLQMVDRVVAAVRESWLRPREETGDILAFLPGAEEIRRAQRMIEGDSSDVAVFPLYGSLSAEEQNAALRPHQNQKVILATNIAETSLTIDGVRTVIDSGYARIASFDADRGLDRLDLQRISKASADQRAGRAGRTAPGRCIRLWSAKEQTALDEFDLPEIKRVDLSSTVLGLHAWGKPNVRQFGWYESPDEETLGAAERLLAMLGALDNETNGEITQLGKKIVGLPVHPRLGRLLIVAAEQGVLEVGSTLASLMSEKDILFPTRMSPGEFRGATVLGTSDLLYRLSLLDNPRADNVDPAAVRQVLRTRDELLRLGRSLTGSQRTQTVDEDVIQKLPLNAYPDRVVKRREIDPSSGVMVGGGGVRLAAESTVKKGDFFLALDARHDPRSFNRQALVRVAHTIEKDWLQELFPQSIRTERVVEFDEARQRVVGLIRTWYRDLLLQEDGNVAVEGEQAGVVLAAALQPRANTLFNADPQCAALLARVALLREQMPEHPWPLFDSAELDDLLTEHCAGKTSVAQVQLQAALLSRLVYPLDRILSVQAPEEIEVPSGSRIRIQYAAGQPPVLAARLQELFGWTQTPLIANGRVPLQVHLLGPNYRPVQITDDLQNFWKTTYFQVRKDLRARYPKHSWPEDPLAAEATARGGRRK